MLFKLRDKRLYIVLHVNFCGAFLRIVDPRSVTRNPWTRYPCPHTLDPICVTLDLLPVTLDLHFRPAGNQSIHKQYLLSTVYVVMQVIALELFQSKGRFKFEYLILQFTFQYVHSKNTEAPFPIYYYIYYCPKWYTYSCNIKSSSYDQFQLLHMYVSTILYKNENRKKQVTIFDNYGKSVLEYNFDPAHRNKNKLRTNWGWSSQEIKNNERRQKL